jgi:hypothetical protein
MGTCAVMGQAAGTAAALCAAKGKTPRALGQEDLRELQLALIRDDCYLPGVALDDPADLARRATLSASSQASPDLGPENLVSDSARPVGDRRNAWEADASQTGPTWVQLEWPEPVEIGEVRLVFDTCLSRVVTLTHEAGFNERIVQGVPEECVADYLVGGLHLGAPAWGAWEGQQWEILAQARGNHQRHRVHRLKPVRTSKLRVMIRKTRGDRPARLYQVRVFGPELR